VVTLVDCEHAMRHLNEEKPRWIVNEVVEEVAYGDWDLLNKVFSQISVYYLRTSLFCFFLEEYNFSSCFSIMVSRHTIHFLLQVMPL
jgi:hypothetical protein